MKRPLLMLRVLLESVIGFILVCIAVHNIFLFWPAIAVPATGYASGYILGTAFFLILGIFLLWDVIRIFPRLRKPGASTR